MNNNLTKSAIDRQNILNNNSAIENIYNKFEIKGLLYNDEYKFTTKMVADFYEIDIRTVKRYVESYQDEIKHNGYVIIKGIKLKEFKELFGPLITENDNDISQRDINVPLSEKTTDNQSYKKIKALALFNFRALLNLGMLLTESDKAKNVRGIILNIVIDTINKKIGGSTKYINQRDEEFLNAITREPIYRKEFTSSLSRYLEMGPIKYSIYTDAIYNVIFKENAKEYKKILKLEKKENLRDTLYSEVLKLIASFEIGIADELEEESQNLGRKLKPQELNILLEKFANKRHWLPQIEDARIKMASRDYSLRNVTHERLENYISTISRSDYDKFLGDKSKSLIDRVIEDPNLLNVFKRLKDR
ncbi:DNA-binding protein [Tenacibaculum finnmarkense]|uniref:DNA-binding protein n=1 Tax=Tenacibaculum finnmarkense TaxID=2781243 RepID=UPI001E426F1F|nr:DNA-binding protein [Tenacibaculum finnmarkense]MCD8421704.1 DNA-binding protein [Tenacibaculum finnmarkense genomovar ulcerans]MCG8237830.1 DNA-binding protein [Tenacibaculum finnmarkense genomovar ulcerans]